MNPVNFNTMTIRALVHGASAVVIMSFYGGQVCPFVEGLGPHVWMLELSIVFAIFLVVRQATLDRLINGLPATKKPAGQFWFDLVLYLTVGITVTLLNNLLFEFPMESGLKILLGVATLGFFGALDMALSREHTGMRELAAEEGEIETGQDFFSITRKFTIFTTVITILAAAVFILVIVKDIDWILEAGPITPEQAKLSVIKEILFIFAVIFAHILNLILSYSRNLKLLLNEENRVLVAVAEGDLSTHVTVGTNDEFGIMARYTNLMLRQLGESKRNLEEAQDKLVESERLRVVGEFASMIVHEIRSPLNVMQMVLEYFDKRQLSEGERKRLDLAGKEVVRLSGLMNEILLYAKPQELTRERLDLARTLNGWRDIFGILPAAQGRNLQLDLTEGPVWVEADVDKLKQVMVNLVNNAYEAAPEGDTVQVSLRRRDEDCAIEVLNSGEPVSPERLRRLKEPFYTTKTHGTGLGLPIVDRIVAAHGGVFSIVSSPQQGTLATVSLPARPGNTK